MDLKEWLILGGINLAGAGISAWGQKEAADDLAKAAAIQGAYQDKLSRDVIDTALDVSNEAIDIDLGLHEPWRATGIMALAGLADMLNLDRGAFGEAIGLRDPGADLGRDVAGIHRKTGAKVFQDADGYYYTREADGTQRKVAAPGSASVAAPGSSFYQAEYDYDRSRIDKATDQFYSAPKFDWKESLEGTGYSFEYGGVQAYNDIMRNLMTLGGFGMDQGPSQAAAGGVTQTGAQLVESGNYITAGAQARATGKAGLYNTFGQTASDMSKLWGLEQIWGG